MVRQELVNRGSNENVGLVFSGVDHVKKVDVPLRGHLDHLPGMLRHDYRVRESWYLL